MIHVLVEGPDRVESTPGKRLIQLIVQPADGLRPAEGSVSLIRQNPLPLRIVIKIFVGDRARGEHLLFQIFIEGLLGEKLLSSAIKQLIENLDALNLNRIHPSIMVQPIGKDLHLARIDIVDFRRIGGDHLRGVTDTHDPGKSGKRVNRLSDDPRWIREVDQHGSRGVSLHEIHMLQHDRNRPEGAQKPAYSDGLLPDLAKFDRMRFIERPSVLPTDPDRREDVVGSFERLLDRGGGRKVESSGCMGHDLRQKRS